VGETEDAVVVGAAVVGISAEVGVMVGVKRVSLQDPLGLSILVVVEAAVAITVDRPTLEKVQLVSLVPKKLDPVAAEVGAMTVNAGVGCPYVLAPVKRGVRQKLDNAVDRLGEGTVQRRSRRRKNALWRGVQLF
jgi:hypothetical protein